MGLLLGMSAVTIIEILDLILYNTFFRLKRNRVEDSENKGANEPSDNNTKSIAVTPVADVTEDKELI